MLSCVELPQMLRRERIVRKEREKRCGPIGKANIWAKAPGKGNFRGAFSCPGRLCPGGVSKRLDRQEKYVMMGKTPGMPGGGQRKNHRKPRLMRFGSDGKGNPNAMQLSVIRTGSARNEVMP